MNVYFFGCRDDAGHYTYRPDGTKDHEITQSNPWKTGVDGRVQPKPEIPCVGRGIPSMRLSHKDGWTCLAFWDRTVDTRPGSCGAFLADAHLSGTELLDVAKRSFPQIWRRLHRHSKAGTS